MIKMKMWVNQEATQFKSWFCIPLLLDHYHGIRATNYIENLLLNVLLQSTLYLVRDWFKLTNSYCIHLAPTIFQNSDSQAN